ncbi:MULTISPECIES: hypothetical protein [Streptomyces]|uniref:Uncharacterized protein n=1 Tax=Streptomyces spororaveus TaxID=284039 RepID=A0ABQ3TP81_9ACTN|nr:MULTISPECIES: hypothetical protein [Streptomyces]MCM9077479.1 hypothetical protein [Streptomyces spororaveus]MCX5308046.1 hypothetical protein [Streptomyces sp. NBC_00160]GHI82193.1 hypothetical protein Sspor_77540 [Streptomyces spororaveus]
MLVFYACVGGPIAALVGFLLWTDRATRTKNLEGLQMEEQARQQARFDKLSPARRFYIPPGELNRRR